jgi:dihydropteroate synthase
LNTHLQCGGFSLSLERPLVMGIVNITPDSFSDGGRYFERDAAIAQALRLVEEGADIVDIGGESSRPGAAPVSADEELARLLPVLRALRDSGVPVSVDTVKPEVMRAVLDAGAAMINDITALSAPGAIEAVAASNCAVCLMHMQGEPRTMQAAPHYDDVIGEVRSYLAGRVGEVAAAGVARTRIVIDPGFGFGKTVQHNLDLLRRLEAFRELDLPVLAGWSRKSSLGRITGRPEGERLAASLAAAVLALDRGAKLLRVHDVAATRDAVAVFCACRDGFQA